MKVPILSKATVQAYTNAVIIKTDQGIIALTPELARLIASALSVSANHAEHIFEPITLSQFDTISGLISNQQNFIQ